MRGCKEHSAEFTLNAFPPPSLSLRTVPNSRKAAVRLLGSKLLRRQLEASQAIPSGYLRMGRWCSRKHAGDRSTCGYGGLELLMASWLDLARHEGIQLRSLS